MRNVGVMAIAAAAVATAMAVVAAPSQGVGALRIDVVERLPPHRDLKSIRVDGRIGAVGGALGTMLFSNDGGATWTREQLPTELSITEVAVDREDVIAISQKGQLHLRDAAIGEWQRVASGTDQRLLAVDANGRGFVVVSGAFGTLLVSQDHGRNFQPVSIDWMELFDTGDEPHLYGVAVDRAGRVTVVGEFGLILQSPDFGLSWSVVREGDASLEAFPSLFAVTMLGDGTGYAVGQRGTVLATVDHGLNWAPVDLASKASYFSVHADDQGRVAVAGMREIQLSDDRGQSWIRVDDPVVQQGYYAGIALVGSDGVLAVGNGGRVLRLQSGRSG